jgi:hypothetical protein
MGAGTARLDPSTRFAASEVDDPSLTPDAFTIRGIMAGIADRGDPFRDVLDRPQHLPLEATLAAPG